MSTKKVEHEEEGVQESAAKRSGGLFDMSRNILLAAVGAVAIAEEEITSFVDQLVQRGEIAEKDARRLVRDVLDRREKISRERHADAQRNRPVTVATKSDIEALNARIAELSEKLEEMKKGKAA